MPTFVTVRVVDTFELDVETGVRTTGSAHRDFEFFDANGQRIEGTGRREAAIATWGYVPWPHSDDQ